MTNFWGSFKIKSLEIWTPAPSNSVFSCSIEWIGGQYGTNKLVQDSSNNVSVPAHVLSRPPSGCSAGFWQSENVNEALFNLVGPSNTIVDLCVMVKARDDVDLAGIATARTGSTVGNIYYAGLDGKSSTGSSNFTVLTLPF